MSVTVARIVEKAQTLWPPHLADEWDAPGLISGHLPQEVTKVLLSVDVTDEVVDEAIELGCQLIIAHHPYLLRGVKTVATNTGKGALLSKAIVNNVAIFAAHTNADVVEDGVSDTFAKQLGLREIRPLMPTESASIGHGRVGTLETPVSLGDLALALARLLPPTATGIRVAGDHTKPCRTIALCGGAGDSFIAVAAGSGADVYITSDLRHHPVQDSREAQPEMALIDVSHWASESLWLQSAASQLSAAFSDLDVVVSDVKTDPWNFTVTQ